MYKYTYWLNSDLHETDLNEKLNLLEKQFQKSLVLDVMKNYILKLS